MPSCRIKIICTFVPKKSNNFSSLAAARSKFVPRQHKKGRQ
jgi:hypothetical protein